MFEKAYLEFLSNACKELKDLKITNVYFRDFTTESEVKEIFPNCKLELKKCGDAMVNGKVFDDGYFWSGLDLTSLDGEIELMFTQNYEEAIAP